MESIYWWKVDRRVKVGRLDCRWKLVVRLESLHGIVLVASVSKWPRIHS